MTEPGAPASLPALRQAPEPWTTRGYLRHFDIPGATQMVTYRLADALPAKVAGQHRAYAAMAAPTASRQLEEYLDAGHGSCFLRIPAVARLVEDALFRFDGNRYQLIAWVIMPNHVHVLIRTGRDQRLAEIVHSWKSYTATASNRILGRRGPFWQREYFDRLIRDERHLRAAVDYVHRNPCAAGLVSAPELWPFSSAGRSAQGAGKDAGAPGRPLSSAGRSAQAGKDAGALE